MLPLFRKPLFAYLLFLTSCGLGCHAKNLDTVDGRLYDKIDFLVLVIFLLIILFVMTLIDLKGTIKSNKEYARKEKEDGRKWTSELLTNQFLIQSEANELKASSAIKNHNLSNHYMKIQLGLMNRRYAEVEMYVQASAAYSKYFYQSLLKEKISLQEEIEMFEKFHTTENILNNKEIDIRIVCNDIDKKSTRFLSDTFASLFQNSINNAFLDDSKKYTFSIYIFKADDIIECIISDDGVGDDEIDKKIIKDHYLDILRRRVVNSFRRKRKELLHKDVFSIESSQEKGTTIKLKLPYETI